MNEDFSLCPSYPRAVIVPRAVDDDALARSARFRQGGRFPVLSYHHAPSGTVSPAPPQTPQLGPTACPQDPCLHWPGQLAVPQLPWLLPFLPPRGPAGLAQSCLPQLRPRPSPGFWRLSSVAPPLAGMGL